MILKYSQRITLFLVSAVLLTCVIFGAKLWLTDYIQLMIFGIIMSILYVAFASNFEKYYFRMLYVGCAFSFLVSIFDKLDFVFIRFGLTAVLIFALIIWISPLLFKKISFKSFFQDYEKRDGYFLLIISITSLIFFSIETAYNIREGKPIFSGNFFYLKYVNYTIIYLLIIRPVYPEKFSEKFRVKFLVFSFLIAIAIITITGTTKVAKAYSVVRAAPEFYQGLEKNNYREKLLRVFSLNSREAFLLYEAGYNAGIQRWQDSKNLLDLTDPYERLTVQEAKLNTALAAKDFDTAINLLEGLPKGYKFKNGTVISKLFLNSYVETKEKLIEPKLHYLGGLLALHCNLPKSPEYYLTEFLQYYPQHANAVYFLNKISKIKRSGTKIFSMPATDWLKPKSKIKTVTYSQNYLTIVYNQHIEGKLWLEKGIYKVSVFARDDGISLETARKTGFDPACKMRVWIGKISADFKVFSENKKFTDYSFDVKIGEVPIDIIIEFTNDIYNKEKKWDRNLSISYLEFERIN